MQRPSVLQLEQSFLKAWPAFEEQVDGGWLWRAANGYTKRANSAQAMDPDDVTSAPERLALFADWARARGNQPVFRVTPLAGTGVIGALNTLNWQSFAPSVVMATPVGARFNPKHDCQNLPPTEELWISGQAEIAGFGQQTQDDLGRILAQVGLPTNGVLVHDDAGRPAASALTTVSDGIGVYLNVVVRPDLRGKGFGRSVMQSALNWSRDAGAKWAAMQVIAENKAALALYRGLGFDEIYRYHYRQAPDANGAS